MQLGLNLSRYESGSIPLQGHAPEDIPKLVQLTEEFDMVIGARAKSTQRFLRKIANTVFNLLATYVTGVKIEDLTSGFRVFKKSAARQFLYLLPNRLRGQTAL